MEKKNKNVNMKRMKETFSVSSSIGATQNNGLHRLTLTEEDKEIRDIFISWLEKENLEVRIDDAGNIYGRREGEDKEAEAVVIGSHLDTQPNGGRFDGILGVLSALEVIRMLNEDGIKTQRPIEIVNFTNEEGERFTPPMMGSGIITGNYDKREIYNIHDSEGMTFEEALKQVGYMGSEENRLKKPAYFIELHVEQGPILEKEQKDIGIVEGVKGMTRFHVEIEGQSCHAAFPAVGRRDALVAASEMVLAIEKVSEEFQSLSTTVGVFEVNPSVINIVTGKVNFAFDVRHIDDTIRWQAIESIESKLQQIAEKRQMKYLIEQTWNIDGTYFSELLLSMVKEFAEQRGYSHHVLASGAGHDAKFMNDIVPSAMIFAPSWKGLSHCEEEFTSYEEIEKCTNVLFDTVLALAEKNNE